MPDATPHEAPQAEPAAFPFTVYDEGKRKTLELHMPRSRVTGEFPSMKKLKDLVLVQLNREERSILTHGDDDDPDDYRQHAWQWKKQGEKDNLPDDGSDPSLHIHPGDVLIVRRGGYVAGRTGGSDR